MRSFRLLLTLALLAVPLQAKPRARDLGIPFNGTPGPRNAITDVPGVEVGQVTLVEGEGRLVPGKGPVRTGVTAVLPRSHQGQQGQQGQTSLDPVFAGWYALNGNGEMTGTTWIDEGGFLAGPILITNTHSVGVVRDAVIDWYGRRFPDQAANGDFSLPVVAETWDGFLNDIFGFHVRKEHAFQALETASDRVEEGNVGGGTGMISYGFKGGIGTASRRLAEGEGGYTIGVLVQSNHGRRNRLTIAGVPVGKEIPDLLPKPGTHADGEGSIIVVVATDAPLLPTQLRRLARRAALGIGRVGGAGENTSGDILLAFSTANPGAARPEGLVSLTMLPNDRMDPLLEATVDATEEAIVNAMIAAETMTGADGNTVYALPQDRLLDILKKYHRLKP
ncbi:MAG: P1 family peptidase [Acidobacteriota bacterium]